MKVLDFNPESLAPDDYCSTWEAVVRFLDGVFQARKRIRRGRFLMVYTYIYIHIHTCMWGIHNENPLALESLFFSFLR